MPLFFFWEVKIKPLENLLDVAEQNIIKRQVLTILKKERWMIPFKKNSQNNNIYVLCRNKKIWQHMSLTE